MRSYFRIAPLVLLSALVASAAWRPMPRLALVHDLPASDDDLYYYFAAAPAFIFRHGGDTYQAPVLGDAVGNETVGFFFEMYRGYVSGRGGLRQLVAVGGVPQAELEYARAYFGVAEGDVREIVGSPPRVACELSRDWTSSEYVVVAPYVAAPTTADVESAANAASIASYLNAPLFYAEPGGFTGDTLSYLAYLEPRRAVIVEIGDALPASVNASLRARGVAIAADLKSEREVVTYVNDLTDPASPVLCGFRGRDYAAPAAIAAARYGGYVLEIPESFASSSRNVWEAVKREGPQGPRKLLRPFVMPASILEGEQSLADRFYAWLEGLGGADPGRLEYVLTFAPASGEGALSYTFDRAILGDTETPGERGAAAGRFANPPLESLASLNLTSAYRALIFSNPRPEHVTFCGLAYMAQNVVTNPPRDYFTDNYGRPHKVNEVLGCRGGGYDDPGVFTDFKDNAFAPAVHDGRRGTSGQHPLVPAEDLIGFPMDIYLGTGFFYATTHGTSAGFYTFIKDDGIAANVAWGEADWPGGPSGYVNFDGERNFKYTDWGRMGRNNFGLVAAFNACSVAGGGMGEAVARRLGAASVFSYMVVNAPASGWFWISFVNRMVERGYTLGEALCFATAQVSEIFPAHRGGVDSTIRYVLAGDPLMPYYQPTWRPPTPADPGRDYGGHHPGGSGSLARDFDARAGERRVTLSWRKAGGRALKGWNIYRAAGDAASARPGGGGAGPAKINTSLIGGASPYLYVDAPVENGERYHYWLEAVEANGRSQDYGPFAASPEAEYGKPTFALVRNFPNPFREATTIVFAVPEDTHAEVVVYDIRGAVVRRLWKGPAAAGGHVVTWDGRGDDGASLPPGVYLCRLAAGGRTAVRKTILVR